MLALKGRDLTWRPLAERRQVLSQISLHLPLLLSEPLPGTVEHLTAAVRRLRLEGIVAKRLDSRYEPGKRSEGWVKSPIREPARVRHRRICARRADVRLPARRLLCRARAAVRREGAGGLDPTLASSDPRPNRAARGGAVSVCEPTQSEEGSVG
ncbi:MAG: hypothetical protein DMF89_19800 [Acidobacteria bacterium]|nr:MAG: hypothetical protein DMF89_19800 [Acidobacteriota bacterium]